jgi:methyl-accepting chemotaxis protein
MQRPPTYARAGRAIIKRPRGSLYLAEDIDPILDQVEANADKANEQARLYEQRRIENETLTRQVDELTSTVESLEKEMDRVTGLLEKAEEKVDILYQIKKMIP